MSGEEEEGPAATATHTTDPETAGEKCKMISEPIAVIYIYVFIS